MKLSYYTIPSLFPINSFLRSLQVLRAPANPHQVHRLIAPRDQKYQSNFVEFRNNRIVYRRYAGLFFCVCVDANDNELAYLEAIHFFVEVLDSFFGNVCELDLVFNFYKVSEGWSDGSGGKRRGRRADRCRCTPSWTKCSLLEKYRRRASKWY